MTSKLSKNILSSHVSFKKTNEEMPSKLFKHEAKPGEAKHKHKNALSKKICKKNARPECKNHANFMDIGFLSLKAVMPLQNCSHGTAMLPGKSRRCQRPAEKVPHQRWSRAPPLPRYKANWVGWDSRWDIKNHKDSGCLYIYI